MFKQKLGYILYNTIGIRMPRSFSALSFGARRFRQFCAHLMLENCGKWVNIERGVHFGMGLTLGEGSGIGENSQIPGSTVIGNSVMMGSDCLFFDRNHRMDDLTRPMGAQGFTESKPIVIGNDVWIGSRVIILPGVHVGNGCVIGAGSVVTHDIPDYEVWGGNPAHRLKSRLEGK